MERLPPGAGLPPDPGFSFPAVGEVRGGGPGAAGAGFARGSGAGGVDLRQLGVGGEGAAPGRSGCLGWAYPVTGSGEDAVWDPRAVRS